MGGRNSRLGNYLCGRLSGIRSLPFGAQTPGAAAAIGALLFPHQLAPVLLVQLHAEPLGSVLDALPSRLPLGVADPLNLAEARDGGADVPGILQRLLALGREGELAPWEVMPALAGQLCQTMSFMTRSNPCALAVLLYSMGSMIGRVLGVSGMAVLKWVRAEAARRRLLDRAGLAGKTFVTDDWEGYRWVIPEDQFTGKDLTFPIEQDNSNVGHCLMRSWRRTKVVPKCRTMVDLSLRLLHHLQKPKTYAAYAEKFRAIFG